MGRRAPGEQAQHQAYINPATLSAPCPTLSSVEADIYITTNVQVAILEGLGHEGAPGPCVLDSVYKTDALAKYVVVQEVPCTPLTCQRPAAIHSTHCIIQAYCIRPRRRVIIGVCCRMAASLSSFTTRARRESARMSWSME